METEKIPLDQLDIEWVEPRVCEETFENRQALRDGGWKWRPIPPDPETGQLSGLIEVPTAISMQDTKLKQYADILVDSRNPWSEFVDARELPIDVTGVPYWIHRRVEKWRKWEASVGHISVTDAGRTVVQKEHAGKEPYLPSRCKSLKKDGTRCWGWAVEEAGNGHCKIHMTGVLTANLGYQAMLAKIRILQAMPAMADALEEMALNAASEPVRLKAITEMMDRGGVHAATDVNIGVTQDGPDPATAIRERLTDLGERLAHAEAARLELEKKTDIVDAEVVAEQVEEQAS